MVLALVQSEKKIVPAGGGSVTLRTRWTIKQSMTSDRYVEIEMPFELRE
ncbi:MAG: hypothetical protein IIA41_03945 [SAR324 cluster bacterium]|nr:hypothetical protein [SAR324 cluster bacterium]